MSGIEIEVTTTVRYRKHVSLPETLTVVHDGRKSRAQFHRSATLSAGTRNGVIFGGLSLEMHTHRIRKDGQPYDEAPITVKIRPNDTGRYLYSGHASTKLLQEHFDELKALLDTFAAEVEADRLRRNARAEVSNDHAAPPYDR